MRSTWSNDRRPRQRRTGLATRLDRRARPAGPPLPLSRLLLLRRLAFAQPDQKPPEVARHVIEGLPEVFTTVAAEDAVGGDTAVGGDQYRLAGLRVHKAHLRLGLRPAGTKADQVPERPPPGRCAPNLALKHERPHPAPREL